MGELNQVLQAGGGIPGMPPGMPPPGGAPGLPPGLAGLPGMPPVSMAGGLLGALSGGAGHPGLPPSTSQAQAMAQAAAQAAAGKLKIFFPNFKNMGHPIFFFLWEVSPQTNRLKIFSFWKLRLSFSRQNLNQKISE